MTNYKLNLSLLSLMGITLAMGTANVVHASLDTLTQQTKISVEHVSCLIDKCIEKQISGDELIREGNKIVSCMRKILPQIPGLAQDNIDSHTIETLQQNMCHMCNQIDTIICKIKQERRNGVMQFIKVLDGPLAKLQQYVNKLLPALNKIQAHATTQARIKTIESINSLVQNMSNKVNGLGRLQAFSIIKSLLA